MIAWHGLPISRTIQLKGSKNLHCTIANNRWAGMPVWRGQQDSLSWKGAKSSIHARPAGDHADDAFPVPAQDPVAQFGEVYDLLPRVEAQGA